MDVRPSPIAGQWYPSNPKTLARSIDDYLSQAILPSLEGEVVAVISPHAGHLYSGPVAGYAFAAVVGLHPELVAVISPLHLLHYAAILTSAHQAYETPLGIIPIDQAALSDLNQTLKKELGYPLFAIREDEEHSLEIELPFLQRALDTPFNLLPVMLRDVNPRVVYSLGKALAAMLRTRSCLLVASTDLSHFYPAEIARSLDGEMLKRFQSMSPEAVLSAEEEGLGFACGRGAVAAVMVAALELGANRCTVLKYATSGDVTGDNSQVVGYGAAVLSRVQS